MSTSRGVPKFEPAPVELRYRVFMNAESTIPVATFIIQTYAEEFASTKFTHVDLWVVRDIKHEGVIVARNPSVPAPVELPPALAPARAGPPVAILRQRRRSTD